MPTIPICNRWYRGNAGNARRLCVLLAIGGLITGCLQEKPILLQGNATSAQVGFSRDIEAATAVARRHCAQYERVPRFVEAEENVAFFDCVQR
jgi:hypothetical protein